MSGRTRIRTPLDLSDRFLEMQEEFLREVGWNYTTWRTYWVWQKSSHDVFFTCLSIEEALRVEQALYNTAKLYPPPAAVNQDGPA